MVSLYCYSMLEPHPLVVPVIEEVGFVFVVKLIHLKVDHDLGEGLRHILFIFLRMHNNLARCFTSIGA